MTKNFERIVELARQAQTLTIDYVGNANITKVSFRTNEYYVGISADSALIIDFKTGEFDCDMIEKDLSIFNAIVLKLMIIIPKQDWREIEKEEESSIDDEQEEEVLCDPIYDTLEEYEGIKQ